MGRFLKSWIAWALLATLQIASAAWAGAPVSYRPMEGESWPEIAARHGVTPEALDEANLGGIAEDGWLRLPAGARLTDAPVIALMASARAEIAEIIGAMNVEGVYRIVGREFHVGEWQGRPVVAGVAGGNQGNAAIGATILFHHFNARAMGFVGIAGGGGSTRIGDVLVASGALPHDYGNWYDFEMPGGETFAGLTWNSRGGPPVLSDAGREARQVLFPDAVMMACIRDGLNTVELPLIGEEVALFHGVERYHPRILLDGWSASGAQFVTSHHMRQTLERRMDAEARRLGVPPPAHFIVDQEDYGAVLAAEEHGVAWFVVRAVVDLAAQKQEGAGLPLSLYDDPGQIPAWLSASGQQSYARDFDWSYFYRLIAQVAGPIVRSLEVGGPCLTGGRS